MYILITYDVDTTSRDGQRRLRQVSNACKDFGQRVQNSVFECELSEAQLVLLQDRIGKIIDHALDSIRIYYLNKNSNRRIVVMGKETSYNLEEAIII